MNINERNFSCEKLRHPDQTTICVSIVIGNSPQLVSWRPPLPWSQQWVRQATWWWRRPPTTWPSYSSPWLPSSCCWWCSPSTLTHLRFSAAPNITWSSLRADKVRKININKLIILMSWFHLWKTSAEIWVLHMYLIKKDKPIDSTIKFLWHYVAEMTAYCWKSSLSSESRTTEGDWHYLARAACVMPMCCSRLLLLPVWNQVTSLAFIKPLKSA